MPFVKKPIEYPLVAGGETYPIPVTDSGTEYLVTGTETITVDNVFQHSGSLSDGLTYIYKYQAAATYNGGAVKFHGVAMSASQALKNHIVIASYDSTAAAWNVDFIPDLAEDNVIAITKLSDLTRGYVIIGNSTGVPVAVNAKTVAYLLAGDGTDCLSMEVDAAAGSVAVTVAGGKLVFTIGNLKVLEAMLANSSVTNAKIGAQAVTIDKLAASVQALLAAQGFLTFDVTVTSAEVLLAGAGGTPIQMYSAPGAGLIIDVISATEEVVNAGAVTAYAVNTTSQLIHDTADIAIMENTGSLARTIKGVSKYQTIPTPGAGQTQYVVNKALMYQIKTGNPTTGNSDIRVQGVIQIKAATV